jgi:hypothetical protein
MSSILFFRRFRTYLEFRVQYPEIQVISAQEVANKLKIEDLMYITGQKGEFLPVDEDIDLSTLTSSKFEVGGIPYEEEDVQEPATTHPGQDYFERSVWDHVVNFLTSCTFPGEKQSQKSRENFSRRCRRKYCLGSTDADGPTLFFTSGGRGKNEGKILPATLKSNLYSYLQP